MLLLLPSLAQWLVGLVGIISFSICPYTANFSSLIGFIEVWLHPSAFWCEVYLRVSLIYTNCHLTAYCCLNLPIEMWWKSTLCCPGSPHLSDLRQSSFFSVCTSRSFLHNSHTCSHCISSNERGNRSLGLLATMLFRWYFKLLSFHILNSITHMTPTQFYPCILDSKFLADHLLIPYLGCHFLHLIVVHTTKAFHTMSDLFLYFLLPFCSKISAMRNTPPYTCKD